MRIGSKTVGGQFTLKDATIVIADSCHSMFLDTQSGDYYGQNVNVLIQNITITSEKTDLTIYFNGWDGRTYTLDNVSGTYKAVLSGISGIPSMELSKIQGIDVEVTTEGSETVALSTTNDAKINVLGSKGGVSVTVKEKSNLTVTTLEDVTVNASGTIKYDNIVGESKVVSGDVVVDKQGAIVDSFEDAALAFSAGAKDVILGKEENGKFVNSTVYLNNNEFTVPAGKTLTINNATVYSYNEPKEGTGATDIGSIKVLGTLYLESADVRASISTSGDDAEIIVTKAKKMTVTGDSTADLGVGYGNTLVLADLIVPAGKYIEAYGTVIIEGTVTVQSNNGFHIYKGGNAQIDGALVIEGTATIDGEAVVNGSVKVFNTDGKAKFTVGETGEVDVLGTMDVLKGKTKDTFNALDVDSQKFNVEGTLTVTGKLEGNVNDMGTIVFNGVADDATIVVYDGVTLTIASVTGDLTITDAGITDEDYTKENGYYVSTGNNVALDDVKNVTVSVVLNETSAKDDAGKSIRLVTSEMTITGAIVSIDDKETEIVEDVDITGASAVQYLGFEAEGQVADTTNDKYIQGTIIIGDVTLGEQIPMAIVSGDVTVTGTVTVVADESSITVGIDAVDVDGVIVIAGEEDDLNVNGAFYTVTTVDGAEYDVTTYYKAFDSALADITNADENTVTVVGEVDVIATLEVPAEATIVFADKAVMTIDVDGKITVAVDAVLDSKNGKLVVDGMLVIMDKEYGLEYNTGAGMFIYQVLNETETTATYSGLVLALQNAIAGDVITLKQDATISKSTTIPEGVTLVVPKNVTLSIGDEDDKVTLTVAGTLEVEGSVKAVDGAESVEILIPGEIIGADKVTAPMDDYISFDMKVDGRTVHVHSNLAYAAENAVNGLIEVIGNVSGGDVTFTQAEKGDDISISIGVDSTLAVGTLTLVGDGATITAIKTTDATKKNGTITGIIATAAGSVDLNKVSDLIIEVDVDETVDSKTDVMIVKGSPVGTFNVASGTITAADKFQMNATKDNKMSIASGAVLLVDAEFITNGVADDEAFVIVDGTISIIKDGEVTIAGTTINGNIDVASGATLDISNATVIGTLSVAEKTDDAVAGKVTVTGVLVIGTVPAIGGNGTVAGPIAIDDNGFIIAYAGADVSAAVIDENNGTYADSTEVYVNGNLFMTVYVDNGNDAVSTETIDDYMVIEGYLAPQWSVDGKAVENNKISDITIYDKIDAVMEYDSIELVVSAGVGLKVYIDGLSVENYKVGNVYKIQLGIHTVSFAVESGYDGSAATITVNGVQVSNNGTFTLDVDDKSATIIASGAVPAQSGSTVVVDEDDGMALTDILLIVLVVLIVIMAIIVALRMMRS